MTDGGGVKLLCRLHGKYFYQFFLFRYFQTSLEVVPFFNPLMMLCLGLYAGSLEFIKTFR